MGCIMKCSNLRGEKRDIIGRRRKKEMERNGMVGDRSNADSLIILVGGSLYNVIINAKLLSIELLLLLLLIEKRTGIGICV